MSWTASLDDEPPPPEPTRGPERPGGSPNFVLWVAGAVLALAAAVLVVPIFTGTQQKPTPGPTPTVLGRALAVPMNLSVPNGATVTTDGRYVSMTVPGEGALLVTVPQQVVEPTGVRAPLPADPADWLRSRSDVYIGRVRAVVVGGNYVTQVDYRRSASARPQSRFVRMSLFCAQTCTQITPDARVRATFLAVGGRTVLVEAVWEADAAPPAPEPVTAMPAGLRRAYDALLTGVGGPSDPSRVGNGQPGQTAS